MITKYLLLAITFIASISKGKDINLPLSHSTIIEKLLFFKRDTFKVFYGGPVDRCGKGVKWMMPIVFEDEFYNTRAVYEVAFINCDLTTAAGAEILFVEVADINIKLKNILAPDYDLFSSLLAGKYNDDKYVVVRFADVANVYFPDIFVFSEYGSKKESDKNEIVAFLHQQFQTGDTGRNFYSGITMDHVWFENLNSKVYKPVKVVLTFDGRGYPFTVEKIIQKNDSWKIYYIISKEVVSPTTSISDSILVRVDSGCVSGQIYDDETCDCLDQLHDALKQMAKDDFCNGIIIHIPGHDGRGFGTAPKAETEIYKRGGRGRIHSTDPLDTIAAAKLLYGVDNYYDLRSFDGVAQLLKAKGIKKVTLLTDNIEKVNALRDCGIEVSRQKTDTNKASCLNHITAKMNSSLYFSE